MMIEPKQSVCRRMLDVARELVSQLPDRDVRAAFVFGSVAWGDADQASDVDIMVCVDRPSDYREVTRVRVADIIGGSFPDGPMFADLDRISLERFVKAVGEGGWHERVVRSVVLTDVDGSYGSLRESVTKRFAEPTSRRLRANAQRESSLRHVDAARRHSERNPALSALHARLGLEDAAIALLAAGGERNSATHLLASTRRILTSVGRSDLHRPLVVGLGLDGRPEAAEQGMRCYNAFADALRAWMSDPRVVEALRPEDHAWAAFTYADETYEEIDHKLTALRRTERTAEMLAYVDGLLKTPIRMNVGKVLNLRLHGTSEIPSITDFHKFLEHEPILYERWVSALRLDLEPRYAAGVSATVSELLDTLERVVELPA